MQIPWDNFNLFDEINILRIMCGIFLIPHIFGKYIEREFTVGFFTKAGFKPPERWIDICLVVESVLAIALISGLYVRYVAIVAAAHMLVATGAVYRVSSGKWFWNLGGYEYCLFWTICLVIVAMHG